MMMKKPKIITAICLAFTLTAITFSGCKKDDHSVVPSPVTASKDNSGVNENFVAASSFNDAAGMVTNGISRMMTAQQQNIMLPVNFPENVVEPLQAPCAKVTVNMETDPHTGVVDFGGACTDVYGNLRSGRILISWSGLLSEEGSKFALTFDNYYFNSNKIDGHVKVENKGKNAIGHFMFNVITRGSLTVFAPRMSDNSVPTSQRNAGKTMTYTAFNTIEWVMPDEPGLNSFQVYYIQGRSEGTTLDRTAYATEIQQPLKKLSDFPFYVSGTMKLTLNDGATTKKIDYGYWNNQKDNLASVQIGSDMEMIIELDRNPFMIANLK
jgi:hypothetical protein